MKLDKIKFAELIAYVQNLKEIGNTVLKDYQIEHIDSLCSFEQPQPDVAYPSVLDISKLMELMAAGTQKIEAIKLYRKLTGWGLKESKDEVEKYWISKPVASYTIPACFDKSGDPADGTLGDILATAIK